METDYRPDAGIHDRYRLTNPLEITMRGGVKLRIESAVFEEEYIDTFQAQLNSGAPVEVKFCVDDDEEIDGTERVEQYQIRYFPKYDEDMDEINHSTVVEVSDSITNGNMIYHEGKIYEVTSNHRAPGYSPYEAKITEFAATTLEELLSGTHEDR